MLCLGMDPPEAALHHVFEDVRSSIVRAPGQVLGREPGDPRLFAEPGLLPLGEAPGRLDRLVEGTVEGLLPQHVKGELAIADGLERRQVRAQPPIEQPRYLLDPALLSHPGHAAYDRIV